MELSREQIAYCMECGVCTGSCPVSRLDEVFSPRIMIKRLLVDQEDIVTNSKELWKCITCARCSVRCPAAIDFPSVLKSFRQLARKKEFLPEPSHHEVIQTIQLLQLKTSRQNRTQWARRAGQTVEKGEIFYFVGCLPYFNIIFRYLNLEPIKIAESFLKILNLAGIKPVVSDFEVCCGHDALWTGDEETFLKLAKKNLDVIKDSGAKRVVFTCPEGYVTFKHEYPKVLGTDLPFEVVYGTEFLEEKLSSIESLFRKPQEEKVVTFQDPCRLGRLGKIYESPRKLINSIPGVRLVEMERSRENSLCCGTSGWIECSSISKSIQIERLNEAITVTGVSNPVVITACPKCYIHLNCAKEGPLAEVRNVMVEDLYTYIANHLGENGHE